MDKQESNFTGWTHISYEKIPENPNNWKLAESDFRAFKKTAWVVTEKIHGANFCIITDGSEVRFAKRKEFLQPDEDFFGHQSLQIKLAQQVKDIFQNLQAERPQTFIVSVYGELFGGEYPHPDVPVTPNVQAVQTGIYYSPKIEFCAFDIAVEENSKAAKRDYIDYDKALKIFQQVEMLSAKPLFIGKYEQAVAQNIEFESTIPALLGLPKLPFSNKAEGIVIKPVKSIYIDTPKGRVRPVLKRKIPEFAEENRYHQAEKWTSQKSATATNSFGDERWLKEAVLALVTENRLINTMSKVGRVSGEDTKKLEKVFQLFVNDVLEAFNESYESILKTLPKKSQQTLIEQVEQESKKLMSNYFKQ
ncbi:RNA ligase family protein [Coleofasciculus sp. FACHB-1120]|uniref:RNA ligase family protein n=1 Tax=Coleofasciculus sp. FACHB-1120 TaxID=2692783 RepID=UPI0016845483|nr:RNA ligase family protein [Coleofasciculus sp. FACHB-1120]MBD2743706.1 RNA ligase [Coleofasciculus sp. FACHB-1120]